MVADFVCTAPGNDRNGASSQHRQEPSSGSFFNVENQVGDAVPDFAGITEDSRNQVNGNQHLQYDSSDDDMDPDRLVQRTLKPGKICVHTGIVFVNSTELLYEP